MYSGLFTLDLLENGEKDIQLSEFQVNNFRSFITVSRTLLWCDGPYEAVTRVRHRLSLLNGTHQPLLVADFCRSMTPLTQRVYVLVS